MDGLYMLLIVVGCALTIYFSVPKTCIFTLSDLREMFLWPAVIAYAATVAVVMLTALIMIGELSGL